MGRSVGFEVLVEYRGGVGAHNLEAAREHDLFFHISPFSFL